jgi:hypothetical protein
VHHLLTPFQKPKEIAKELSMPPKVSSLTPFKSVTFKPIAPDTTPIKQLALSSKGASLLTPKAAQLTKADLIALHNDPKGAAAELSLSVSDVNSIRKAFAKDLQISGSASTEKEAEMNVTVASCCTPCCCAAAVPIEVAIQ